MFRYIFDKILGNTTPNTTQHTTSILKPISLILSVSILLFSVGYILKPVSEIIDELHDSNESYDSNEFKD